jgi:transposase
MRSRWEVNDKQWAVLAGILKPKAREDGRARPWNDTRAVLNGVLWVLGTGAQWRELPSKYPPHQTCHRRLQQWVRTGQLENALQVLAQHLQEQGKLKVEEAFSYASYGSGLVPRGVERGRRSSLSPLVTVFLSPLGSKALARMNLN